MRRIRGAIDGRRPPFLVAVTGYGLPEDRGAGARGRASMSISSSRSTSMRSAKLLAKAGADPAVGDPEGRHGHDLQMNTSMK